MLRNGLTKLLMAVFNAGKNLQNLELKNFLKHFI